MRARAPAFLAVSRSTGKCVCMKRPSISRVGDTLPHACPGSRPSASAAACHKQPDQGSQSTIWVAKLPPPCC